MKVPHAGSQWAQSVAALPRDHAVRVPHRRKQAARIVESAREAGNFIDTAVSYAGRGAILGGLLASIGTGG
jgi:hypothetical protein